MLHIVNGNTVADQLKQGVVQGDVLAWREIFIEGELATDLTDKPILQRRAKSLEKILGVPTQTYIESNQLQEKRFDQAITNEEPIVLWFEHDLFDQTILCYLLYRLHQASFPCHQLYLLSLNQFPGIEPFHGMGQLSVQQMKMLTGHWKPVQWEQMKLGFDAWQAYTSQTPYELEQFLRQNTKSLPFLEDAFRFHLNRFPSTTNGLGITEQITLQSLVDQTYQPQTLFQQVSNQLPLYGMGDLQYWSILRRLYDCPFPLIELLPAEGGKAPVTFPTFEGAAPTFWECEIRITAHGKAVLRGIEDRILTCGIDRWFGGVHVQVNPRSNQKNTSTWRWDSEQKKLRYV